MFLNNILFVKWFPCLSALIIYACVGFKKHCFALGYCGETAAIWDVNFAINIKCCESLFMNVFWLAPQYCWVWIDEYLGDWLPCQLEQKHWLSFPLRSRFSLVDYKDSTPPPYLIKLWMDSYQKRLTRWGQICQASFLITVAHWRERGKAMSYKYTRRMYPWTLIRSGWGGWEVCA